MYIREQWIEKVTQVAVPSLHFKENRRGCHKAFRRYLPIYKTPRWSHHTRP